MSVGQASRLPVNVASSHVFNCAQAAPKTDRPEARPAWPAHTNFKLVSNRVRPNQTGFRAIRSKSNRLQTETNRKIKSVRPGLTRFDSFDASTSPPVPHSCPKYGPSREFAVILGNYSQSRTPGGLDLKIFKYHQNHWQISEKQPKQPAIFTSKSMRFMRNFFSQLLAVFASSRLCC
jgi:hypothetical protein